MSAKEVRVRIAPSPTGFAHVGTGYTALFNYAYAKKNEGTFIVRIEDTDVKRNIPEAEKAIYDGLSWLGIDFDEGGVKGGKYGPYKQSQKLEVYKKRAEELIGKGLAYEEEGAIRFKNPGDDMSWNDLIHGQVTFPGGQITDFVIMKSDGYPTYNFGVVIDDIDMKITHVIRGEEHISNTPRQLALYKAFNAKPPEFAHHVTLRGIDRRKLSKRRDPVDLRIYKEQGFLPEALVNFLCLLGWSHPKEKEIFSLQEFVETFDLSRMRKAGPVFDINKLLWINGQYIQKLTDEDFAGRSVEYAPKSIDKDFLIKIAPLVKSRLKKLNELKELVGFFIEKPKVDIKMLGENYKEHLQNAIEVMEDVPDWNLEKLGNLLLERIDKKKFKTGNFFMDLRIAVTGRKETPPINDSIIILGKEETLKRIVSVLSN